MERFNRRKQTERYSMPSLELMHTQTVCDRTTSKTSIVMRTRGFRVWALQANTSTHRKLCFDKEKGNVCPRNKNLNASVLLFLKNHELSNLLAKLTWQTFLRNSTNIFAFVSIAKQCVSKSKEITISVLTSWPATWELHWVFGCTNRCGVRIIHIRGGAQVSPLYGANVRVICIQHTMP